MNIVHEGGLYEFLQYTWNTKICYFYKVFGVVYYKAQCKYG